MHDGHFALHTKVTLRGRRFRWNLVAPNGEVVATSEVYNSRRAALDGIKAVQRWAPGAGIRYL